MAAALDVLPPPPAISAKAMAAQGHSCPRCGTSVLPEQEIEDAQRKIMELEAQVEMLKEKATSAVDKCADYEDQLRTMKRTNTFDSNLVPDRLSTEDTRPSTSHSTTAGGKQSRFSFLTGRRGSPAQSILPPPPPPIADPELLEQLEKERALRAKAEERAKMVDSEIEELSVQLFSQANEMVATERKARAKLEARVEQLEKKDKDKMARLERLENAVSRVERVKALLAAPSLQQRS